MSDTGIQFIAKLCRKLNRLLDYIVMLTIAVMFLYGSYSLYDNYRVAQGGKSSDLFQYKPETLHDPTFEELKTINPDVIGWITIEDTNIDYPLVQGENDMVYVNQDAKRDFSLSGAIFLSSLNERDFSDPYSLIYGHHLENGSMFSDITKFVEKDYFDAHRYGTIMLNNQTIQFEIFASTEVDANDRNFYFSSSPKTLEESFITEIQEHTKQSRDIFVTTEDHIIGLSTCYDAVTNGRVIVFAKIVQFE